MQYEQGHLGGYEIGGDPATYYPDLWDWAVKTFDVSLVWDVGCGEGHAMRYFRDTCGCSVLGIEGIRQDDPMILKWDYTKGSFPPATLMPEYRYPDLIWCCEFLEHLEERYLQATEDTFKSGKVLMVTHAFPGQGGYHHVNCREPDYWKGFFAGLGFSFDVDVTNQSRVEAAKNKNQYNHYIRSGMVFRRY